MTSAAMLRTGALLACLLALPGAPARAGDRHAEDFRRWLRAELERSHLSPESIGFDDFVAKAVQKLESDPAPEVFNAWVRDELASRWLSFAPIRASAPPLPKLDLPFDRRVHWIVGQGISTSGSHTGDAEFALDFAMPEGTPILAARRGRVARVVDGFTACCLPKEQGAQTNAVYVVHRDGSYQVYAHLRPGVVAREGQAVQVGDLLGYSGSTGYANVPHLHFETVIRTGPARTHSIPMRFRNGTPGGYLPKEWRLYSNRPRPAVELRVSANGSELASAQPFLLEDHSPVSLRVERIGPTGPVDVTRDPHTRYVALTPWSLRIDGSGRVLFMRSSPWAPLPDWIELGVAVVTILYQSPELGEGYFDVRFRIEGVRAPENEPAARSGEDAAAPLGFRDPADAAHQRGGAHVDALRGGDREHLAEGLLHQRDQAVVHLVLGPQEVL
jgi:murein DD-endopeptidase MepM/ murein hydrolase activator NlpD